MKVKQLQDRVEFLQREIGCDGTRISSHNFASRVRAYCPDTDQTFEVIDVDPTQLPGCGCYDGLTIILKPDD